MPHIHNIIDTDSHFYINPVTRVVSTKADKLYVVQYDHDSERFTFQLPRYVEEHDMSLCHRIEIHYDNITRNKKEQNSDVYIVKSKDISYDYDTFFFSWLVSGNATKLVGSLKFSISFVCLDEEGNVEYEWSTALFENIQVLTKLENSKMVQEKYPDLYQQLKQDILDTITSSGGGVDRETVERIIVDYLESNLPEPGAPGKDGDDGYSPTIDVTETETGYKLVITDVNGTYVTDIRHGKDGKDGTDGEDGISPTIDVTQTEEGYILTITDVNGTKTATIRHGSSDITIDDVKSAVDEYLEENPAGSNHPVVDF